ncbi:putative uncharacterized protein DDB_G0282133 [Acyrthosiphon pisum]|uniref:DUF4806 domain-containing protein n=1 Tax=Acyrthosiphon pisum TaxID=7029 RepID=A0A8R2NWY0_ACYPI|nr:putative uncharacterized protein DDB_G0282133 [Acyrthosiphon pisum]
MSWTIVCFEEENCVEIVPDYWFKNGCCAWPKKSIKNYKKFVDRRIEPNEIDFDYFKARSMSHNIVSLHDARAKLKIAEETSELSTFENEKSTRSERHRQHDYSYNIKHKEKTKMPKQSRNRNFNDSEGISIEDPPVLNSSHGDVVDDDNVLNSPSGKWNVSKIDNNTMIVGTSKKRLDFTNTHTPSISKSSINKSPNYSPSLRKLKKVPSNSTSDFEIITNEERRDGNSKSLSSLPNSNSKKIRNNGYFESHLSSLTSDNNMNKNDSNSETGNNYSTLIDVVNQLVRSTGNLKYEIRELSKKIDSSENTMMNIADNCHSIPRSNNADNNYIEDDVYCFPLTTIEELNTFEEKLSSDNIFCKKMISELSRLERSTISETTRQIMSKIFHDNLLTQFSYQGQKKKRVFSILKTCSIIFSRYYKKY